MTRCLSAAATALALLFVMTAFSAPAGSSGAAEQLTDIPSFRPDRVRAFAVESDHSVVVREARQRFLRLTLASPCPALISAHRLAFQIGPGLVAAVEDGTLVPIVRNSAPPVISVATPHAHAVVVGSEGRATCRLLDVAEVDQSLFDAAAAVHGRRDNRYAGDSRPAG
jgi:hypothetical protein